MALRVLKDFCKSFLRGFTDMPPIEIIELEFDNPLGGQKSLKVELLTFTQKRKFSVLHVNNDALSVDFLRITCASEDEHKARRGEEFRVFCKVKNDQGRIERIEAHAMIRRYSFKEGHQALVEAYA